jgi:radical SAM superfamily enzyme YgiQ (UPF0313 family)
LIAWQKSHPRLPLMTQVSLNLADDARMTAAMVEAGFDTVFIGIESPDTASLEECSKKQNCNRDMVADTKKLQRAGLEVQGGFIVGFDHDTADVFQQQIDFITESGIVTAMVGQLQAAPGTRLKNSPRRRGTTATRQPRTQHRRQHQLHPHDGPRRAPRWPRAHPQGTL